ncbi:hypothetical protein DYB32_005969 [Aphanomyces invadans]|uniref:Sas10 C-terminal domain-containing protein n=1 Tax=Aphanomyces invadans TaxID=157072 RepID=A0A418AST2_9STRA|nr:hypothetical protein DYB32_005969 [Aphanomyces invadans]
MASIDKLTADVESLKEKLLEFQEAIKVRMNLPGDRHDHISHVTSMQTDLVTENGMGLLQVKNHAMMQYSQLSLYYALHKLKYQVDKLCKMAVSDSKEVDAALSYAPNPEAMQNDDVADGGDDDDGDDDDSAKKGIYKAPRLASVPYEEEEKEAEKQAKRDERNRKRMAKSTILSEIRDEYSERPEEVYTGGKTIDKETLREEREKTEYEESRFVRVVTSRKDKIRKRQRERDAIAADSIGKMDNFAGIHDALGEFAGKRFVAAAPQKKLGGKIGGIFSHVDVSESRFAMERYSCRVNVVSCIG